MTSEDVDGSSEGKDLWRREFWHISRHYATIRLEILR